MSVAFAQERWIEREQAFAAQISQLQALVDGRGDETPTEAAVSEAGELLSVDQLDDDDAWRTMAKAKRRSLLSQERDALAKKMRTRLGGLGKVSACPFKKKG